MNESLQRPAIPEDAAAANDPRLARKFDLHQNKDAQEAFAEGGDGAYTEHVDDEFATRPRVVEAPHGGKAIEVVSHSPLALTNETNELSSVSDEHGPIRRVAEAIPNKSQSAHAELETAEPGQKAIEQRQPLALENGDRLAEESAKHHAEAEKIFAEKGEAAYTEYVKKHYHRMYRHDASGPGEVEVELSQLDGAGKEVVHHQPDGGPKALELRQFGPDGVEDERVALEPKVRDNHAGAQEDGDESAEHDKSREDTFKGIAELLSSPDLVERAEGLRAVELLKRGNDGNGGQFDGFEKFVAASGAGERGESQADEDRLVAVGFAAVIYANYRGDGSAPQKALDYLTEAGFDDVTPADLVEIIRLSDGAEVPDEPGTPPDSLDLLDPLEDGPDKGEEPPIDDDEELRRLREAAEREHAADEAARERVRKAADDYAKVVAEHAGNNKGNADFVQGTRLRDRFRSLLSKIPGTHAHGSVKADEALADAKQKWVDAQNEYLGSAAYKATHSSVEGRRFEDQQKITKAIGADDVETLVDKYLVENAQNADKGVKGWLGKTVYKMWSKFGGNGDPGKPSGGRFSRLVRGTGRGAIVGVPAAGLGYGLGVAADVVKHAAIPGFGILAGAAGYGMGHGMGKAVNRRYAAHGVGDSMPGVTFGPEVDRDGNALPVGQGGRWEYGREVTSISNEQGRYNRRKALYAKDADGRPVDIPDAAYKGYDPSSSNTHIERYRNEKVDENERRRKHYATIGGLAAGAGFAAGLITGNSLVGSGGNHHTPVHSKKHHPVKHHGHKPTNTDKNPGQPQPTNGNVPNNSPNLNLNQYAWTYGDKLTGSNSGAWHSINHTINVLNNVGHQHYSLRPVGNTIELFKNGHVVNWAQERAFNVAQQYLHMAAAHHSNLANEAMKLATR